MSGTVCCMSWMACVTSKPSNVTAAGPAAASGSITAAAGNMGPEPHPQG